MTGASIVSFRAEPGEIRQRRQFALVNMSPDILLRVAVSLLVSGVSKGRAEQRAARIEACPEAVEGGAGL